jgi:hypothetical protein
MSPRATRSKTPETLLDEAYLLVLTRRPTAASLARELGVSEGKLDRILVLLSAKIKKRGLRVVRVRRGEGRLLEIRFLKDPTKAAQIGPRTLRVRRLPSRRPGLKPEDEIIYARDW